MHFYLPLRPNKTAMQWNVKVMGSLLLSMIFWAFSFVWIKQAFISFNPLTIIFFRLVLSAGLMYTILKVFGLFNRVQKHDLKWFGLLAFFEPFLYFVGESFGLKVVPSTMGAVIVSTIPLFAPVAERLFFKTRLSWLNWFGIGISFLGVLIIIFEEDLSLNAPLYGILLVFLAVFAAIGYAVVLRKIPRHYNAVTIITYQNFIGIFYFLPFFLYFEWGDLMQADISSDSILAVLQLAVFASSIAFILFTYSIRVVVIAKANVFVNLIPVFTAFFAWWILDESLTLKKMIGIVVVIGGIFISQIQRKKKV
jgi:drug/metabolite transporter (DMT)-like permease